MFSILEEEEEDDDVHAELLGEVGGCCTDNTCLGDGDDIATRLKYTRAFHGSPIDQMLTQRAIDWADCSDKFADLPDVPGQPDDEPTRRTIQWAKRVRAQALADEAGGVPWQRRQDGRSSTHFQGHPGG